MKKPLIGQAAAITPGKHVDHKLTMDNPKPGLPTITLLGMTLPIIADLGNGWYLVAHENGAAIANKTCLSVLWTESTETSEWADDESTSPVPESVRAKAVEEFERLAWPLVRDQFYNETTGEVPA